MTADVVGGRSTFAGEAVYDPRLDHGLVIDASLQPLMREHLTDAPQ